MITNSDVGVESVQLELEESDICGGIIESEIICEGDFINSEMTEQEQERPPKRGREKDSEEVWNVVSRKSKRFGRMSQEGDLVRIAEDLIEVSLTCTEKLPKQFGLAKLLKSENIKNIIRVKYVNSYKVIIQFSCEVSAETILQSKKLNEGGYKVQKTLDINQSYGVIHDIDMELNDEEVMEGLSGNVEILGVKRLKRRNSKDGHWELGESVRVTFKGSSLPSYIYIYDMRTQVHSYTFPVTQCSRCWRFGHTLNMCPSLKTICPKCTKHHANCDTTQFKCNNCSGRHMAMAKICPVFKKEKTIRDLMSEFNCSYKKALMLYTPPSNVFLSRDEEFPNLVNNIEDPSVKESTRSVEPSTSKDYRAAIVKDLGNENRNKKGKRKHNWSMDYISEEGSDEDVQETISEGREKCKSQSSRSLHDQISWQILLKRLKDAFFDKENIALADKLKGDLNGHHTNWSTKVDVRGRYIFDSMIDKNFISLNDGSCTRIKLVNGLVQKSSPDVTLISADIALKFNWSVLNESLGSDHLMIKINTEMSRSLNFRAKRNFRQSDWLRYKDNAAKEFAEYILDVNNLQLSYNNFIDIMDNAAKTAIPVTKICEDPVRKHKFSPKSYWNQDMSKAVAERRRALAEFRRNPTPDNLTLLNCKIKRARSIIRRGYLKSFREFCTNIDSVTSTNDMWAKMKWFKGNVATKDVISREKAYELLCKLTPAQVTPQSPEFGLNNNVLSIPISLQELNNAVKRSDSAPGFDDISYSMYADDIVVYFGHKNVSEMTNTIQEALNMLNCILGDIGLDISQRKTKFCVFHRGRRDNGSKSEDGCGAAFFDPQLNIKLPVKLNSNISIMHCELMAIAEALSYVDSVNNSQFLILSDSKSALFHLARLPSRNRGLPIAYSILDSICKLKVKNKTVQIQWIPSHVGIEGNEEADRWAKYAVLNGVSYHLMILLPADNLWL
ncbi:unnamed protein product [Leptosia nina]|uniref:RNase H type-1 domain-containing protein n=1 Tax=Leptosia nina TaxID=320188 RepID=A0AAV1JZ68_9NEOP